MFDQPDPKKAPTGLFNPTPPADTPPETTPPTAATTTATLSLRPSSSLSLSLNQSSSSLSNPPSIIIIILILIMSYQTNHHIFNHICHQASHHVIRPASHRVSLQTSDPASCVLPSAVFKCLTCPVVGCPHHSTGKQSDINSQAALIQHIPSTQSTTFHLANLWPISPHVPNVITRSFAARRSSSTITANTTTTPDPPPIPNYTCPT